MVGRNYAARGGIIVVWQHCAECDIQTVITQLRFERHHIVHQNVGWVESAHSRCLCQPSSVYKIKPPAMLPCNNTLTPHLFPYVLMRVSQIWVVSQRVSQSGIIQETLRCQPPFLRSVKHSSEKCEMCWQRKVFGAIWYSEAWSDLVFSMVLIPSRL